MPRRFDAQPLRLSISHLDDATFELTPDDLVERTQPAPEIRPLKRSRADRSAGQRRFEVTIDGWVFTVLVEPAARAELRERAGQGVQRKLLSGKSVLKAQLPGRVVRLWVAEGDTVQAGQRLLAIEAMKMENEVRAPQGGTIASLKVAMGGSVELGDELLMME